MESYILIEPIQFGELQEKKANAIFIHVPTFDAIE